MNKVTIYLDGDNNTLEVKEKILSVLPNARSMIFDAGEPYGELTRFQKIKAMGLEEMAEYNVKRTKVVDEYDDSQYYIQVTSDGTCFMDNERDKAVAHEIAWLNECGPLQLSASSKSQSEEEFNDYNIALNG